MRRVWNVRPVCATCQILDRRPEIQGVKAIGKKVTVERRDARRSRELQPNLGLRADVEILTNVEVADEKLTRIMQKVRAFLAIPTFSSEGVASQSRAGRPVGFRCEWSSRPSALGRTPHRRSPLDRLGWNGRYGDAGLLRRLLLPTWSRWFWNDEQDCCSRPLVSHLISPDGCWVRGRPVVFPIHLRRSSLSWWFTKLFT